MSDAKNLPGSPSLTPEFAALTSMVRDAKRGEMRLPPPTPPPSSDASPPESARLPSGWYREPAAPKKPQLSEDLVRAAVYGLATGLVILLPLLLWQSKNVRQLERAAAATAARSGAVAAQHSEGLLVRVTTTSLVPVETAAVEPDPAQDDIGPILEEARQRIGAGDITGARTVLAKSNAARNAQTLFLSAETYDPNMLAAWGARGVIADPERARSLYAAANALGHEAADGRLAALR